MKISSNLYSETIFTDLRSDFKTFEKIIRSEFHNTLAHHGFHCKLSEAKLIDVFELWTVDLRRVKEFELPDSEEIDHFKQSAHLIYWLRRSNPISEVILGEAAPDETDELAWHKLVQKYSIQYVAMKIGFDLCRLFESEKIDSDGNPSKFYTDDFNLDIDYYNTCCHMLKTKNASPHAIYVILKSIFFDPLGDLR